MEFNKLILSEIFGEQRSPSHLAVECKAFADKILLIALVRLHLRQNLEDLGSVVFVD